MAEEKKYSLISVDVASDDEEVVHVGAQGAYTEAPAAKNNGSATGAYTEAPASQNDGLGKGADSTQNTSYEDADRAPSTSSAQANQAASAAKSSKRADEGYVATEDDLEGPVPMAGLQKAVIAVVILILVGFVAYFGFAH